MRIAFTRWRSGGLFNRPSPRKRLLPKKKTSSGFEFVSGLADGASAMPAKWSRPVFSFRFYEGKISRALGRCCLIRRHETRHHPKAGDSQSKALRCATTVPNCGHYVAYARPPGRVHRAFFGQPAKCEVAHTPLPIRPSNVRHNDMRKRGTWHRNQNPPYWGGEEGRWRTA